MKQQGRIVLASASPRRRSFFDNLGLQVEVIPSEIAEVGYGGDPALVPQRITKQKVKAVRTALGSDFVGWIVGADTVVALGTETFGKPKDAADAKAMLSRLSKQKHKVFTGFRVENDVGEFRERTVMTEVEMTRISESQMDAYIASGEPFDKAGAYAIQEKGGMFVKAISGSYSNVVGLPLAELVEALYELEAVKD